MWGTTLLGAKLTGDLGNVPEGTTSDYCLFPPLAGNLSFGILGLLQQYRPETKVDQVTQLMGPPPHQYFELWLPAILKIG